MTQKLLTVIYLTLLLISASCAPKTSTITPLSESDKSGIKKMAIHVQADEDLIESISKIKESFLYGSSTSSSAMCSESGACIIFLLIDLMRVVGQKTNGHMDQAKEKEFDERLSRIQLDKLMAEYIDDYFESTNAPFDAEITELQSISILAQQGFDTLLDMIIVGIDVKLCPKRLVYGFNENPYGGDGPLSSDDEEYTDAITRWNEIYMTYMVKGPTGANNFLFSSANALSKEERKLVEEGENLRQVMERYVHSVRIWLTFSGKITSTKDGKILWNREQLYYDPKCESVAEVHENPELAVDMMTRAIGDLAINIANEIQ